jgi:hypothetical protein
MKADPLNLKTDPATAPMIRLTLKIVEDAIRLNADVILLELDMELHMKAREELIALKQSLQEKSITKDQYFFKFGRLPDAGEVIYVIGGKRKQMPPFHGELFECVVRILLQACGMAPWTKGEISGPLETVNPASKWILESKDLTRRIELRRIRKQVNSPLIT